MADETTASGVQELIDRLSQEGVAEGQRRAEEIAEEARRKADELLQTTKRQADALLKQAKEQSDQFRVAGEDALRMACRDALRDLGSRIHEGFRNRLRELVQNEIHDPEMLKKMILEVTRHATPEDAQHKTTILIPPDAIADDEVRQRMEAGDEDALTEFVKGLIGEDLRSGFDVQLGRTSQTGLRVRVVDQNVEIDLTDEALTDLLARHLLPRFRAVLRG
jgi:V/A-type H+-transporting ATPase subunit E